MACELVKHEKEKPYKLAPHLSEMHISPGHFHKMKVAPAAELMSHKTACAIEQLVDNGVLSTKAQTTAWFFRQVNRWFDLMCSRYIGTAFSQCKPEEHDKAVSFMQFFMTLFRDIKIADGSWKPVQTGVLLSTSSILSLQKDLLKEGYKFVLTARFTQDSLENLCSMIRARNPIPTPYQCKMALRVISVSQYLKHAKKGSYDIDDGAFFLADYRSQFSSSVTKVIEGAHEDEVDDVIPDMSSSEESAFAYLSGYLASSVLKNNMQPVQGIYNRSTK